MCVWGCMEIGAVPAIPRAWLRAGSWAFGYLSCSVQPTRLGLLSRLDGQSGPARVMHSSALPSNTTYPSFACQVFVAPAITGRAIGASFDLFGIKRRFFIVLPACVFLVDVLQTPLSRGLQANTGAPTVPKPSVCSVSSWYSMSKVHVGGS